MSKVNFYGKEFSSRVLIGSALYPSPKIMQDSIRAAGSEIVTVSVRRESAGGGGAPLGRGHAARARLRLAG